MAALFSVEAEQATVGALLLDPEAWHRISGTVTEADFYRADHRRIFAAIAHHADAGNPFDVVTIAEWLDQRNQLDDAGGIAYLGSLAENTPSAANITTYAAAVRERADRRQLAATLADLQNAINGPAPTDELLADAQSRLESVRRHSAGPAADWRSILMAGVESVEAAHARRSAGGTVGAPTGLPGIDRRTGGLSGPRLWVIAGRPSLGKSALALQAAIHAASHGFPCGIISLEMGADEIAQRAIAHRAGLNLTKLSHGYRDEYDRAAELALDPRFAGLPLFVDDDSYSLGGIVLRITEWKRQHNISFAVVDHIGLVETERFATRNDQVGAISRALKKTAKRLDMPVIAVSQLNRRVESEKRRPLLADLRDSGSVEQDADIALFVHCEEPDEEQAIRPVEIGLLKNRGGVRGWLPQRFEFEGATQTFREVAIR